MTVKDYIFYKTSCIEKKILKYKLCIVVDPSKKVTVSIVRYRICY